MGSVCVVGIIEDYYERDNQNTDSREERVRMAMLDHERDFNEQRARVRVLMKDKLGWTVKDGIGPPSLAESRSFQLEVARRSVNYEEVLKHYKSGEALKAAGNKLRDLKFEEPEWASGMKKLVSTGLKPEDLDKNWKEIPDLEAKKKDTGVAQGIKVWEARSELMEAANKFIEETGQKKDLTLKVYPTGSSKFTSDKDVQIAVDVCGKIDALAAIVEGIDNVIIVIDAIFGNKVQNVLGKRFDVNFYPPTILNTYGDCMKQTSLFWKADTGKEMCWAPSTANFAAWEKNVAEELPRAFLSYEVTNDKAFFEDYKNTSTVELKSMIEAARGTAAVSAETWNNHLLGMTRASAIGPEMYTCYSTTIYVVWHMQMGKMHAKSPLTGSALKSLAMLAAVENYIHFTATEKSKYKDRMCDAYRNLDDGGVEYKSLVKTLTNLKLDKTQLPTVPDMKFSDTFTNLLKKSPKDPIISELKAACKP